MEDSESVLQKMINDEFGGDETKLINFVRACQEKKSQEEASKYPQRNYEPLKDPVYAVTENEFSKPGDPFHMNPSAPGQAFDTAPEEKATGKEYKSIGRPQSKPYVRGACKRRFGELYKQNLIFSRRPVRKDDENTINLYYTMSQKAEPALKQYLECFQAEFESNEPDSVDQVTVEVVPSEFDNEKPTGIDELFALFMSHNKYFDVEREGNDFTLKKKESKEGGGSSGVWSGVLPGALVVFAMAFIPRC